MTEKQPYRLNITTNPKHRHHPNYWLNWPRDVQLEVYKLYGVEPYQTLTQRLMRALRRK